MKKIELEIHDDLRKGQEIFNFLEWLRYEKGRTTSQSARMADPFHIQDEEFDKLWQEYQTQQSYIQLKTKGKK